MLRLVWVYGFSVCVVLCLCGWMRDRDYGYKFRALCPWFMSGLQGPKVHGGPCRSLGPAS